MSATSSSFEPHRPRLMRIAYRMLGSVSDAEDVVQDAYLRFHESDQAAIQSVEGAVLSESTLVPARPNARLGKLRFDDFLRAATAQK
jgi:hypothetical protein